jgi:hypothetical protein
VATYENHAYSNIALSAAHAKSAAQSEVESEAWAAQVSLPGAHPSAPLMAFKCQELSNLGWAVAKAFGVWSSL